MTKALATPMGSFLAGVVGMLGYGLFEEWASVNAVSITAATDVAAYVGFFLVPFLICVIGVDFRRWDPDYDWFGAAAKADVRRQWIRWAAYFAGSFVGLVTAAGTR